MFYETIVNINYIQLSHVLIRRGKAEEIIIKEGYLLTEAN